MTKKTWFILAAAGVGLGLMSLALLLFLVFGFFAGHQEATSLPIYLTDQTPSAHAGYRHSTLTRGDDVFINDYEEAGLQLANPEPSTILGMIGPISNAKVCAIPGQWTNVYIAGDCGSEMPAYVPYRSSKYPPFDWRTATFREMKAYRQGSPYLTTTNPALLAEVVRTLRDDPSVELPSFPFATAATLDSIKMTSDQIPGLLFCPIVYTDANGQIYLAESTMLDTKSTPLQLHARWIPVSPKLAAWLKGP